jgi:hypothetical protein
MAMLTQVLGATGAEVVDDPDRKAAVDQQINGVASDTAGSACHDRASGHRSSYLRPDAWMVLTL